MLTDVAGAVRHLEARLERFEARMDQRFTALEGRVTALDHKLDRAADGLSQRIGALEIKLDSHFRWLVGIQFAMFVTVVASLLAVAG